MASFLTTEQLAMRWRVTVGHLANLRCYRKWPRAPRVTHIGRRVLYDLRDVIAFETRDRA